MTQAPRGLLRKAMKLQRQRVEAPPYEAMAPQVDAVLRANERRVRITAIVASIVTAVANLLIVLTGPHGPIGTVAIAVSGVLAGFATAAASARLSRRGAGKTARPQRLLN